MLDRADDCSRAGLGQVGGEELETMRRLIPLPKGSLHLKCEFVLVMQPASGPAQQLRDEAGPHASSDDIPQPTTLVELAGQDREQGCGIDVPESAIWGCRQP